MDDIKKESELSCKDDIFSQYDDNFATEDCLKSYQNNIGSGTKDSNICRDMNSTQGMKELRVTLTKIIPTFSEQKSINKGSKKGVKSKKFVPPIKNIQNSETKCPVPSIVPAPEYLSQHLQPTPFKYHNQLSNSANMNMCSSSQFTQNMDDIGSRKNTHIIQNIKDEVINTQDIEDDIINIEGIKDDISDIEDIKDEISDIEDIKGDIDIKDIKDDIDIDDTFPTQHQLIALNNIGITNIKTINSQEKDLDQSPSTDIYTTSTSHPLLQEIVLENNTNSQENKKKTNKNINKRVSSKKRKNMLGRVISTSLNVLDNEDDIPLKYISQESNSDGSSVKNLSQSRNQSFCSVASLDKTYKNLDCNSFSNNTHKIPKGNDFLNLFKDYEKNKPIAMSTEFGDIGYNKKYSDYIKSLGKVDDCTEEEKQAFIKILSMYPKENSTLINKMLPM